MSKTAEPNVAEKMQQSLADKILPLLDTVRDERARYYKDHPVPALTAVDAVIGSYANICGSIAVACNLVPGPMGMLAIVPEIALVMHQQLKMVYDIARAYGHPDETITRELLLAVVLTGSGVGAGGLIVIQGGRLILRRGSLRLIQRLVAALGGRITQRALRSLLARWVPIVGAGALGLWARYSTKKLGRQAKEIFSNEIILEDVVLDDDGSVPISPEPQAQESSLLVERIRLLIALAWVDRELHTKEQQLIVGKFLDDPELETEARTELQASLDSGKVGAIDYKPFQGREELKIATIMDMIALMKVDEVEHPAERVLIRTVGKEFGMDAADVEELMTA